MLENISWPNYWIFITVILVGYYAVISLKYYYSEAKVFLKRKSNVISKLKSFKNLQVLAYNSINSQAIINSQDYVHARWSNEKLSEHDLFPVVNQFVNEIKITLEQAAKNNLIKQEIIYALQHLVKKYWQVGASSLTGFIINCILIESSNYSSIHLSEEDLNGLWIMVGK